MENMAFMLQFALPLESPAALCQRNTRPARSFEGCRAGRTYSNAFICHIIHHCNDAPPFLGLFYDIYAARSRYGWACQRRPELGPVKCKFHHLKYKIHQFNTKSGVRAGDSRVLNIEIHHF